MQTIFAPALLNRPPLHFGDRHERDQSNAPSDFGMIVAANWVVLEQEGNNVGVYDDLRHAAGSVRLWPRHWWRVSRKSSMDSSSGQKSPCNEDTSAIGPVPCSAISCSTDGCPEAA